MRLRWIAPRKRSATVAAPSSDASSTSCAPRACHCITVAASSVATTTSTAMSAAASAAIASISADASAATINASQRLSSSKAESSSGVVQAHNSNGPNADSRSATALSPGSATSETIVIGTESEVDADMRGEYRAPRRSGPFGQGHRQLAAPLEAQVVEVRAGQAAFQHGVQLAVRRAVQADGLAHLAECADGDWHVDEG